MLRDTLVATVTAVAVVAAQGFSHRFLSSSDPVPDAPLRAALNRPISGVHTVRGAPHDAFAQLDAAGAGLVVDWADEWPYLERENREPINLTLRDATLEHWLQAISFQLSSPYPCYWVDVEGNVHISAPHRQGPPIATRVYDVRELLEMEARFIEQFPRPNFAPPEEPATRDPLVFGEWGWGILLSDLGGGYTWIIKGGGSMSGFETQIGDIDFRNGRLIVSHTPGVHRRINALLAVLRAERGRQRVAGGTR